MSVKRPKPVSLLALVIMAVALLEFIVLGMFQHLDFAFNDLLLRHIAEQRQPDGQIVIVDIDEHSLDQMAQVHGRYPWPRSVHAETVEWIARQKPKAILFDILFTDPEVLRPDDDAYLAEVAAVQPKLYFPFVKLNTVQPGIGLPLEHFGEALGFTKVLDAVPEARVPLLLPYFATAVDGRLGAINFKEDSDGIGRHYPLYLEADGWRLPSLPAKVAATLGYSVPPQQLLRLNWQGPVLSYPRIPFTAIYEDLGLREPLRPQDEFSGKIVIIGSTATGLHDLRATPLSGVQPAVEILATALDNLRQGNALRDAPPWFQPLATLVLVLPLWWAFRRGISPLRTGLYLLLGTPVLIIADYLTLMQGLLPLLTPLLFAWLYYGLAALHAYRQARLERRRSIDIFSRFLDPRVVNTLVSQGESALSLKGESRRITVLFSDIRGFTTLSEKHSAEEIVTLLNDYFSRQVKVIFAYGGTVDKFIGDAIMAFWGAPVDDDRQAIHAIEAALEMADTLMRFKQDLGKHDENFDVGIGIHTGPGVVGFIGSENRLDYTAIGDTVNLASRIEGQTKGLARILVSADTRDMCGEVFDFVDHGFYKVKGRTREVQLFEPRRKKP